MPRHNEAADAAVKARIATGIHAVAAATIIASGATDDELDLARRVLLRDPTRDAPRENESSIEAFNRQMDAVIESCNDSAGESTRAVRRSRLAKDLDRAGLVLLDRNYLAGLIADRISLEHAAPGFDELDAATVADDFSGGILDGAATSASASATSTGLAFAGLGNSGTIDVAAHAGTTETWVGDVGGDPLNLSAND